MSSITVATTTSRHVHALEKAIAGKPVVPGIDLTSHREVYLLALEARQRGLTNADLAALLPRWAICKRWTVLTEPEYLYLIHTTAACLVDYPHFFREYTGDFAFVTAIIPEWQAAPETFIASVLFYQKYDFAGCFDHNDADVQAQVALLNEHRSCAQLLVNPHWDWLTPYLVHVPGVDGPFWDCEGISLARLPALGEPTIAPLNVVVERLDEFSCGLLRRRDDTTVEFPRDVIIAGGSVTRILSADYSPRLARAADVDIFICASTNGRRHEVLRQLLRWFDGPSTYYAVKGSVVTVYVQNVRRKFQIIVSRGRSPLDILDQFDTTHIQWCMMRSASPTGPLFDRVLGTAAAVVSMREKVTYFNYTKFIRVERLVKALQNGYRIHKDQAVIDNSCDITRLITVKGEPYEKIVRGLQVCYYPTAVDGLDADELRQYMICMIERDTGAGTVTTNPEMVLLHTVIGGNFKTDYAGRDFASFHTGMVANVAVRRHAKMVVLKGKSGNIILSTPFLCVTAIAAAAEQMTIACTLGVDNASFREFCSLLETRVYNMYKDLAVTEHIINAHTITFVLPRYILERQITRGESLLWTQNGLSLDLDEDLVVGDHLQVVFTIVLLMYPAQRCVTLRPLRLIKQHAPAVTLDPHLSEPEDDISIVYNGAIDYEE